MTPWPVGDLGEAGTSRASAAMRCSAFLETARRGSARWRPLQTLRRGGAPASMRTAFFVQRADSIAPCRIDAAAQLLHRRIQRRGFADIEIANRSWAAPGGRSPAGRQSPCPPPAASWRLFVPASALVATVVPIFTWVDVDRGSGASAFRPQQLRGYRPARHRHSARDCRSAAWRWRN